MIHYQTLETSKGYPVFALHTVSQTKLFNNPHTHPTKSTGQTQTTNETQA